MFSWVWPYLRGCDWRSEARATGMRKMQPALKFAPGGAKPVQTKITKISIFNSFPISVRLRSAIVSVRLRFFRKEHFPPMFKQRSMLSLVLPTTHIFSVRDEATPVLIECYCAFCGSLIG